MWRTEEIFIITLKMFENNFDTEFLEVEHNCYFNHKGTSKENI